MQRRTSTGRGAPGPRTDPRSAEHAADPPTAPDRSDPAPVMREIGLRLEETTGLEPAAVRTDVDAVARAMRGDGRGRAAAYERALRALPASWQPVLGADYAVLALVDEAVGFGPGSAERSPRPRRRPAPARRTRSAPGSRRPTG